MDRLLYLKDNYLNFADISRHFPLTASRFQQSLGPKLCIIEHFPIQTELGRTFLEAICLGDQLDDIRSMAFKTKEKILQSGTIQILKVNVIVKEGRHVVKVVCLDPHIFFVIFRISLRLEVTHLIND